MPFPICSDRSSNPQQLFTKLGATKTTRKKVLVTGNVGYKWDYISTLYKMTEAEAATTTTTNATLNHQLENEPNHDSPPPNQHHPEIKSTSSNISASNNNNNNSSMINNPTPHRLPEGENAAPLEVIGTTTSDKLVIIMVGLPATGTCMCVCVCIVGMLVTTWSSNEWKLHSIRPSTTCCFCLLLAVFGFRENPHCETNLPFLIILSWHSLANIQRGGLSTSIVWRRTTRPVVRPQ